MPHHKIFISETSASLSVTKSNIASLHTGTLVAKGLRFHTPNGTNAEELTVDPGDDVTIRLSPTDFPGTKHLHLVVVFPEHRTLGAQFLYVARKGLDVTFTTDPKADAGPYAYTVVLLKEVPNQTKGAFTLDGVEAIAQDPVIIIRGNLMK